MNLTQAAGSGPAHGSPVDRAFAAALASVRRVATEDLNRAWARAAAERIPLAWAAASLDVVSELDATMILARAAGLPFVDLAEVAPGPLAVKLVPERIARRHRMVPLAVDDRTITLATSNPSDLGAEQDISFASGRRTRLVVASPGQVAAALERAYPATGGAERIVERLRGGPSRRTPTAPPTPSDPTAAVADLWGRILTGAIESRASEVRMEPASGALGVHFRADGATRPVITLPPDAARSLLSWLESAAGLDRGSRGRPRQGWFISPVGSTRIEVRVLSIPAAEGERIVLRVGPADAPPALLDALGYERASLEDIRHALRRNRGLLVFAGPPASGKTTSLQAAVCELRHRHASLAMVEGVLARQLEGVVSVTAGVPGGSTMAQAVGAALARDPAVLAVGDTLDGETAREAVRAARDRLVLTCVHAPDASSALFELIRLGVEPDGLDEHLELVVAQRLMRRLCPDCLVPLSGDELQAAARRFAGGAAVARPGAGCDRCHLTGYLDCLIAAEVVLPDERIRRALREGAGAASLRVAVERGRRRGVRESAGQAVIDGLTSPDEAARLFDDGEHQTRARRQRPLVLAVDDDRVQRLLVRHLLERAGYDVVEGEDGRAAVELSLRERPDILVLDLMMPELDGYQALGLIRRELALAEMPVLVATADDAPEAERRVLELGADDYLLKPIDREALVQRVRAALSRATRLNA